MQASDLAKILDEHKIWIMSYRENGSRANLRDADLRDADLRGADLRGADLRGADLRDADLRDADLRDADLRGADLRDADLRGADLRDADLYGADLYGADLRDADLYGADLRGAYLPDHTYIIMGEAYYVQISNFYIRAGCQSHSVEEWRTFSKREIADMDGKKALKFYPRLLKIIDFYLGDGSHPEWVKESDSEGDE